MENKNDLSLKILASIGELAVIAAYAMKNPKFREIVSTYKRVIPLGDNEGARVLINHNKLLRNYDGAIGIKTGYTKTSGRCLVSSSARDGVELICVTLSAPSDWQDHESILDLGNSLYESKTIAQKDDLAIELDLVNGEKSKIQLFIPEDITATVRKNEEIKTVIEAPRLIFAPIIKNQAVGKILFIQNGEIIATSPLVAKDSIQQANGRSGLFKIFSK